MTMQGTLANTKKNNKNAQKDRLDEPNSGARVAFFVTRAFQ